MYIGRYINRPVVDTYESNMGNQDVDHLRHILPLVSITLTIYPTTAECKRGFSQMNQVKTQLRTSLNQETISSLLRIKIDGPTLANYNLTKSIVKWLNSGKGT